MDNLIMSLLSCLKKTLHSFTRTTWYCNALFISILCLNTTASADTQFRNVPVTGTVPSTKLTVFDQRLVNLIQRWQLPGAAITIMRNNQILLSRGYGYADKERRIPVQPKALFRIASVSKAITALAILKLVETRKLSLDDAAFKILNNLAPLPGRSIYPNIYHITVRNLLEMSSGWITDGSYSPDPMFGPWTRRMAQTLNYNLPPDCRTAARMMMSVPMQFKPGTQFSYSNINYCLLGLIINKFSGLDGGQGYQAYVQQQILLPLGIHSMRIGENALLNTTTNEVKYYAPVNKKSGRITNISGLPYSNNDILKKNFADGGWIASAPDLATLGQAIIQQRVLTAAMLHTMTARPYFQTKPQQYFALGWTVKYVNGHRYYWKTGSFTGTQALLVVREDDGTSYAALFNAKPSQRQRFLAELQNILFSV